jgi:hypothetical protein
MKLIELTAVNNKGAEMYYVVNGDFIATLTEDLADYVRIERPTAKTAVGFTHSTLTMYAKETIKEILQSLANPKSL